MKTAKITIVFALAALISSCGGGGSDSGAAQSENNSSMDDSAPQAATDQEDSSLITAKCNVTGISMMPASGQLSKKTSSLRAIVDFELSPGVNASVSSTIFSVDGQDRIASDRTEFTQNIQVNNGVGQVLLSYNLDTQPPDNEYQFSFADPDAYNKVVVYVSQSGGGDQRNCESSIVVNYVLTP